MKNAAVDRILLQDILALDELQKNGKVLLIRHSHEKLDELISKRLIEEYQSFQNKPAFKDCKYIVSFVGGSRNSAIFYGLYEVVGDILENEKLPEYSKDIFSYSHTQDPKKDFFINLKRMKEFDKFRDRIVIDWIVPRGWYNTYGEVLDKPVIRLLPHNFVKDFPGLTKIILSYPELQKIISNPESHEEWLTALSQLQAVYLILDKSNGSQYVGTTYGLDGLWQRWESYAKGDGTGGNKQLIELKNINPNFTENLQFSILEVLSKTSKQKDCTGVESLWMKKLGTRSHGLN